MTWNGTYGTAVAKTVNVKGDLRVLGGSFIFIYNGTTQQTISIEAMFMLLPVRN